MAVADAADGRFIPQLEITATLECVGGETIGPFDMPFLWHPGLYHYGRDIRIPGDGRYNITIQIAPPSFSRHDKTNGNRYADPVTVEFRDVLLKTGRE